MLAYYSLFKIKLILLKNLRFIGYDTLKGEFGYTMYTKCTSEVEPHHISLFIISKLNEFERMLDGCLNKRV
jgi:hypothetical protein